MKNTIISLILLLAMSLFSNKVIACGKLTGKFAEVPKEAQEVLTLALGLFCKLQGKKPQWRNLRITQVARGIDSQARMIALCLQRDGCTVYENQEAITEIKSLKDKSQQSIANKIRTQIERGCYVSKHLTNRGVDVGTGWESQFENYKTLVDSLATIISEMSYTVGKKTYKPIVINKRHGTGPHLHINFPPYGFNPKKCPGSS
ncbi:hypothetical protein [Pleionea sp. CnH1-48]|uniref:hypothetical protein n=1 Tax=Pleionea sp. CnH1-48 TaxID=2954494 RepID=UPI002096FDC1|nr:hypothetical protein [Pleionea sp. CnH1-48]MCO7223273.1 hypothetical protein [Pleionea sp. CnH1-48]